MNIYLTLDYELFLGAKTGTPLNCLIRPMDALCNAVEEFGVRFTLFVDAAYLLRLSQLKYKSEILQNDYDIVCANIIGLHQRGHDIQLHFHPQWLYSNWNNEKKEWDLDYSHYKLSDMEEDYVYESFAEAKALLETIVNKKIIAFRAGGYCLESFNNYINLFKQNGIKIDSSVIIGRYNIASMHHYDYRLIKTTHQVYHFDNTIREEVIGGHFVEFPISLCRWNKLYYHFKMRPLYLSYSPKLSFGDGLSIGHMEKRQNHLASNNRFCRFAPFSASASSSGKASVYLKEYYKYAQRQKWSDLVVIGHPKEETDSSIANLREFISTVNEKAYFKCISEYELL